jgi:hypothetical protein
MMPIVSGNPPAYSYLTLRESRIEYAHLGRAGVG